MRAMILAAGEGTRLRPLTETIPKILVPVLGVPMLERLLAHLGRGGVTDAALNTHHLADAVRAHAGGMQGRPELPPLRLYHEPELLGTGGGVANVADFWGPEPLLVWNGDILCDVDPAAVAAAHQQRGGAATLVVQRRDTDSALLVDEAGRVCGLAAGRRGEQYLATQPRGAMTPMAFNGISVLSPLLLEYLPRGRPGDLLDSLLMAVLEGGVVRAYDADGAFFGTTGTPEKLATLEEGLRARPEVLARWRPGEGSQQR